LASLDVFLIVVASADQPKSDAAKDEDADDEDAWAAPARAPSTPCALLSLGASSPAAAFRDDPLSDLGPSDVEFE
jgi:hypothetical protein